MSRIWSLIFILTLWSGAPVGQSDATWLAWPLKSDAFARANSLVVDHSESDEFLENIEAARRILQSANNEQIRIEAKVKLVLEQLVALQPIVKQDETLQPFECAPEDVQAVGEIYKSMLELSRKDPFLEPTANARLYKMIRHFHIRFASYCLEKLHKQYANISMGLDRRSLKTLGALRYLLSEKGRIYKSGLNMLRFVAQRKHLSKLTARHIDANSKRWAAALTEINQIHYDKSTIRQVDPKSGKLRATRQQVAKIFNETLLTSCNYFKETRKDAANIFEQIIWLAKTCPLDHYAWLYRIDQLPLMSTRMAAGYQVCKDLEERANNWGKIIDAIVKQING